MRRLLHTSSRSWTSKVLATIVVLSTSVASAAPLRPIPLEHDGRPGVWFDRGDADRVLHALEQTNTMRATIAEQEAVVDLLKLRVATTTTTLALVEGALHEEQSLRVHFQTAYLAEVERQDSIFHSPLLWALVGVVVGGGAVAAGVFAAK